MTCNSVFENLVALKLSEGDLYDNFPPYLLKLCPRMFAPLLVTLFFSIIHTLIYPDSRKTAVIRPLHKSDCKTDNTNFRPISLQTKVSIIFDKNVFDFLYNKVKGGITERLFGF